MRNHKKAAGSSKKQLFTSVLLVVLLAALLFPAAALAEGYRGYTAESNMPLYLRQLEEYIDRLQQEEEEQKQEQNIKEEALLSHVVKPGDNLTRLAEHYDTTVEQVMRDNQLSNPHYIVVGQELHMLTIAGILHKSLEGETIVELAALYGADIGEIRAYNNLDADMDDKPLEEGKTLIIPGGEPPRKKPLALSSRGDGQDSPSFIWPVNGVVTSGYGPRWGSFHYGLDIAAEYGTPVKASEAGRVDRVASGSGYGLYLVLDHGAGWQTLYAHNDKVLVHEEQWVRQGDTIARMGASGNATGPHVHLEIMKDGQKLDPAQHLP